MTFEYCHKCGFDADALQQRLTLLELGEADHDLARCLHGQVIAPNSARIVDAFYDYLLTYAEYRHIIGSEFRIERLKRTQTDYLLSLGRDFDSAAYFEVRLRIGAAHARVGLPLSLYECAYYKLRQIIIDTVPAELPDTEVTRDAVVDFVSKITALDMSLAIECYHLVRVETWKSSVEMLRDTEVRLRKKAATDPLTGLANREHSLRVLRRALNIKRGAAGPLCVVMADLDHFKEVNDSYGHLVGDSVLRDVAARIQAAVRSFDTVGRYGGEEFVVILENTAMGTAQEIAERVRRRVAAGPINVQGLEIEMTISQGLTQAEPGQQLEALLTCADVALYQAKNQGRNRVVVYQGHAAGH